MLSKKMKKLTSIVITAAFLSSMNPVNFISAFATGTPDTTNEISKDVVDGVSKVEAQRKSIKVNDPNNGDWREKNWNNFNGNKAFSENKDAQYVVREGDIDDFGLGWKYDPTYFFNKNRKNNITKGLEEWTDIDPFTGQSTSGHYWGSGSDENDLFDWGEINKNDKDGLDKIITISSKNEYSSGDGYSSKMFKKLRFFTEAELKKYSRENSNPNDFYLPINQYDYELYKKVSGEIGDFHVYTSYKRTNADTNESYKNNVLRNLKFFTSDEYRKGKTKNGIFNYDNMSYYEVENIYYCVENYTNIFANQENAMIKINHNVKRIMTDPNNKLKVSNATIQMFVDDFQTKRGGSEQTNAEYQVKFIDDKNKETRIPEFEDIINSLNQSGPVGKLITFDIPSKYLDLIRNNNTLKLQIDDPTTQSGEGYAIDFVKLLINKKDGIHKGNVIGTVTDKNTKQPIPNACIDVNGTFKVVTNAQGKYEIKDVPSGYTCVKAYKEGIYQEKSQYVDVEDNKGSILNFELEPTDRTYIKTEKTVTRENPKEIDKPEQFKVTLNASFEDPYAVCRKVKIEDEIAEQFKIDANSFVISVNEIKMKLTNNNLIICDNNIGLDFKEKQFNKGDSIKVEFNIQRVAESSLRGSYPVSRVSQLFFTKNDIGNENNKEDLKAYFTPVFVNLSEITGFADLSFSKHGVFSNDAVYSSTSEKTLLDTPNNIGVQFKAIKSGEAKIKITINTGDALVNINKTGLVGVYELENGRKLKLISKSGTVTDSTTKPVIQISGLKVNKDKEYVVVYNERITLRDGVTLTDDGLKVSNLVEMDTENSITENNENTSRKFELKVIKDLKLE